MMAQPAARHMHVQVVQGRGLHGKGIKACNGGYVQVEFARTAIRDRVLRGVYRRHAAVGGLGLGCFMLEDVAISRGFHFVHALWHLQACYAVASSNALMRQRERGAPDGRAAVEA